MLPHLISPHQNKEILIVEDSPTQAAQLRHLLERHGFAVTLASNGTDALSALRTHRPGLVLSDIVMPEMDGLQLCQAIKRDEGLKDLPVVLLTSLSAPQVVIQGLNCGADSFLRKPCEEKHLVSRLEHLLANRGMRQNDQAQAGLQIMLGGQKHYITAERQQILDLLISTFEEAVHLNEGLTRSCQSLETLYRIAQSLNEATSEGDVCTAALQQVVDLPGVLGGWIILREGESGFRMGASEGGLKFAGETVDAPASSSSCRRLLCENGCEAARNIYDCECLQEMQMNNPELRHHACVPLWVGDRTLGLMNLLGPEEGAFSEADLKMLHSVGNQVGIALERAHLRSHLERLVAARTSALTEEISERKRAEEAVRANQAELATIYDNTPVMMCLIDRDMRIRRVNQQLLRYGQHPELEHSRPRLGTMLGCVNSPKEAACFEHSPACDVCVLPSVINATFETGQAKSGVEGKFRLPHGPGTQEVNLRISTAALVLDHERMVLLCLEDLTQQKRNEAQLLRMQRVESVGRLAGGVAHDLNNVLAPVLLAAELLEPRITSDADRELLELMKTSTRRGADIVKQLLIFSRGAESTRTQVEVPNLVHETIRMIRETFPKSIQIQLHLPDDLWTVIGDVTQLQQVLLNLSVNARDAMPEGGILGIAAENLAFDDPATLPDPEGKPGAYVVLEVTDTGTGIAPEILDKIFDPFFTTKAVGQGTGLGLSTVVGIVKSHSGFVQVHSRVGYGTQFKVYLPASKSAQTEKPPAQLAGQPGQHELILVVDDEECIRESNRRLLEMGGYRVVVAGDGYEALAVFVKNQGEIKAIILDMWMPFMGGLAALRELQKVGAHVPIIAVSGLASLEAEARAASPEVRAFLAKPWAPNQLLATLRDLLQPMMAPTKDAA